MAKKGRFCSIPSNHMHWKWNKTEKFYPRQKSRNPCQGRGKVQTELDWGRYSLSQLLCPVIQGKKPIHPLSGQNSGPIRTNAHLIQP